MYLQDSLLFNFHSFYHSNHVILRHVFDDHKMPFLSKHWCINKNAKNYFILILCDTHVFLFNSI